MEPTIAINASILRAVPAMHYRAVFAKEVNRLCAQEATRPDAIAVELGVHLVKEIVLVADKAYCFSVEAKLRSLKDIGWNIAPGGGTPPGYKMCGDDHPARWPQNIGRYNGGNNPTAIKIKVNDVVYDCIKEFANATGLNYSTAKYRIKTLPAKWGYEVLK